MPYVAPETEADRWPQHARPSTSVHLGGPRRLGHVNCLTGDIQACFRFYTEVLGMRLSDWLGDAGVWFHVNSDHHVMALVDLGYDHFHHLAFDTVDIGKMRDMLDHLARHGRWLGWGPARHGIAGNIASYVRIVEEECFVELYCDMEQLADRPCAARVPGRPLLLQHVGAAATALLLPLRRRSRSSTSGRAWRRAATSSRRRSRSRNGAADRLHGPSLALGALVARPLPAVALRRRLPRRRVLGRSRAGRLVPASRPRAAPGSRTLRPRLRRLAVVLRRAAASCSTRRARSTRSASSSSTRSSAGRR